MGNLKHTPAPWIVIDGWDKQGNGKYFPSVILHGDEKLKNETMGRNSITINVSHDQEAESIMANAKLIASAPNLLETLITLKKAISNGDILMYEETAVDHMDIIEQAIKKATE